MWQSGPHSHPNQSPNSWALEGVLLGHGGPIEYAAFLIPFVVSGPWTFISSQTAVERYKRQEALALLLGKQASTRGWVTG